MKQLPKKLINKSITDDQISQDNNGVDFFASDIVNAQEHARLAAVALGAGLSSEYEVGVYWSRGALILQGMEYVDKGGGLVDIKEGYFLQPNTQEAIYFEGVTDLNINTQPFVWIGSGPEEVEPRVYGDGQTLPFASKYSAVLSQGTSSVSQPTVSVEYNFNNLNNGLAVCEENCTARGVILADYLKGVRGSTWSDGAFNTGFGGYIRAKPTLDGYGVQVSLNFQDIGGGLYSGGESVTIGTMPAGVHRSRSGLNANFQAPFSFTNGTPAEQVGGTIEIQNNGDIVVHVTRAVTNSFLFVIADFTIFYPTTIYEDMDNNRQWKKATS